MSPLSHPNASHPYLPIRLAVNIFSLTPDVWSPLVSGAVQMFVGFLLVTARLGGLFVMSPVFGHPDIPTQVRVFLVLALAFLVTPMAAQNDAFELRKRWDRNRDGWLTPDEIPDRFVDEAAAARLRLKRGDEAPLRLRELPLTPPVPQTVLELTWLLVTEFGLGLALSLTIAGLVAGIQLAGSQIDQQVGVSLGEVFNPELDTGGSQTSEFLYQLAMLLFLGLGGHLLMIGALLDTFRLMPVGYAAIDSTGVEFLSAVVHQSFVLTLRLTAPIYIAMALVSLSTGILSHAIPQISVLLSGFPIRATTGFAVLLLALSGMFELLGQQMTFAIAEWRRTFVGV